MKTAAPYPFRLELERKAIHLSSLWMAAAIYYLPMRMALVIFLIVLAGMLAFELLRWHPQTLHRVPKFLTRTLRGHEMGGRFRPTGATFTLLSAVLAVLLFPKFVAVAAFTIMIVGDAFAALVGKSFGRTKFLDKSVEGSVAFLISSMLALYIFAVVAQPPAGFLTAALVATLAGMLVEALASRLRLDDNLTITLGAGGAMLCLYPF